MRHCSPLDLVNCPPSDPRWSSPLLNFLGHIETPDDDDTNSSEPTVRPRNAIANVELVFELAMELVERVYRRTGAGYMDFPQVLKRVEGMLCAWLRGETAANDDDEFVPGAMGAMPIHAVDESSMVVSFVRRIRITPNHTSDDGTIARPTSMAELWALADQHCPAPSF